MKNLHFLILTSIIFISCEKKTLQNQENSSKIVEKSDSSVDFKNNNLETDSLIQNKITKLQNDSIKAIPKRKEMPEADADFQWDANQKLEKLLKSFGENSPDYYAGASINDQGNLVINIKGDFEKGKMEIKNIIGDKNIIFKQRKFSAKELNDLMDFLYKYKMNPKNKKYSDNYEAATLLDEKALIEVELIDFSKQKITEFKQNVSNSEAFIFTKSRGRLVNQ